MKAGWCLYIFTFWLIGQVLGELSPSLSLAELRKYEHLRDQFEGTLK